MTPPPPRVRVTRTRRTTGGARPHTVREEIAGESSLGNTYVNSLIRTQLQLTLAVLGMGVFTLGALPIIFALIPATRTASVLGMPLSWLVLGLLVYPVVVLTARWYTRSAERIEAQFSDLVERR